MGQERNIFSLGMSVGDIAVFQMFNTLTFDKLEMRM